MSMREFFHSFLMEQFTAIVVTAAGAKQVFPSISDLNNRLPLTRLSWSIDRRVVSSPRIVLSLRFPIPVPLVLEGICSAFLSWTSGGATFNAIVAACEHLSARAGFASVSPDILANKKIVIIHSGGDSRRSPLQSLCGKVGGLGLLWLALLLKLV